MCFLIASPEGKIPKQKYLKRAEIDNSDGWGIAYKNTDKNSITIHKGINPGGWRKYLYATKGQPYILHFRFATSGDIDTKNCHPFVCNGIGVLAHNGIINIKLTDPSKSDTWHFTKELENDVRKNKLDISDKETIKFLEMYVGSSNKISIMQYNGNIIILNQQAGHWKKGIWYSKNPTHLGYISTKVSYKDYYSDYVFDDYEIEKAHMPLWDKPVNIYGSYKKCTICNLEFRTNDLFKIGMDYYCIGCYEDMFELNNKLNKELA